MNGLTLRDTSGSTLAVNCEPPETKLAVTCILAVWNCPTEVEQSLLQPATLLRLVSDTTILMLRGVHIWKVVVLATLWTAERVEEVVVTVTVPLFGSVVAMSTLTDEQSAREKGLRGEGRRGEGDERKGTRGRRGGEKSRREWG